MRIFLWGLCVLGMLVPDIATTDRFFRHRRQETEAPPAAPAVKCKTCYGKATCDKNEPAVECKKMELPADITEGVDSEKILLDEVGAKLPETGFTHCVSLTFKAKDAADNSFIQGCVTEKIEDKDACDTFKAIETFKDTMDCKICKSEGEAGCDPNGAAATTGPPVTESVKAVETKATTIAATDAHEQPATTMVSSTVASGSHSFFRQGVSLYYWIIPMLVFYLVH